MVWKQVAGKDEIPEGKMKAFEIGDERITVANVGGKYYAFNDRCGHMNGPLHMGVLDGKILTCPMHFAKLDVTTGEVVSQPVSASPPGAENLPQEFLEYMARFGELMAEIKTKPLETYEVALEGDWVKVNI